MPQFTRRRFFQTALAAAAAAPWLQRYEAMAATELGRYKIRDIQTMIVQGPRTYTFVKVLTDQGAFGIGEAYGSPGAGVREQVHALAPLLIGKDPLEIEKLYTSLGRHIDGSAHMFLRGVSGVEMALWDLAGRILNLPACVLLGGMYRDKVRVYNHGGPRNPFDKAVVRDWAQKRKEDPSGWNCCKYGPWRSEVGGEDQARDPYNRVLTAYELRKNREGFENAREALGWDYDIIVHCHWEYDLRTSIDLAEAVASIKPLYLEDPLPPDYSESWVRLCNVSPVPIGHGENLARREGFQPFIVNAAADILNPDLRNTGGFLEQKKVADFAHLYHIPFCSHNTGSVLCTMATVQWAAAIRDYTVCETVCGKGDWMDDVILRDEKMLVNGSYIKVPQKPGIGVDLNPEVVKAHLAEGERWWG